MNAFHDPGDLYNSQFYSKTWLMILDQHDILGWMC